MFPQNVLSTPNVPADFLPPRNVMKQMLIDYELGGIGIQDASQGLRVQTWKGEIIGNDVVLSAPAVAPTVIYSEPGITELSITFDQNMQPFIAYMVDYEVCRFRWFDTTISQFVVTTLPAGSFSPRCVLDDKRPAATAWSDIILTYIRGGTLYFRMQRDRYLVEYALTTGLNAHVLGSFGMNLRYRLQWQVIPVVLLPPVPVLESISPNSAIEGSPSLFVTLTGSGFDSTSRGKWNGSSRPTTFLSANELRMEVSASDLLAVGTAQVSVFTPQPGGGSSGNVPFTVIGTYLRLTEDGDVRITEEGDNRVTQEAP